MRNKKQSRVLIVDGDENHQILMEAWFEIAGYKVSLVKYGSDALVAVNDGSPDLVILDVDLPDMDGLDTTVAIKESKPHIPVIINTDYANHRADVRSFTADAFMIKSPNVKELLNKAKEIMGKRPAAIILLENNGLRDLEGSP